MIQFAKLRLSGFKSFVERTELDIRPGLTGIVGPNGCGKSNLVEAMRWVMGESSAKKMRGSGMDDVIFSGTSSRPARSFAEVSLLLDNHEKTAPPAYNEHEEIEVSRKIHKDQGSTYRINGRIVRAQDVQVLFADVISGANSPALISQGQITRIINSKPAERRLLLEESSGIGGLYARRHEAELRLRAADNNLIRLEDIIGSMEKRFAELKKQARQATRYRNVSAQIRQLEIMIYWLEWKFLRDKADKAVKEFESIESEVARLTADVIKLTKTQSSQNSELPEIREQDAGAAAKLQNLRISLQRMEDEARQTETLINETSQQLQQARSDIKHEIQTQEENALQLEKMDEEHKHILAGQEREEAELDKKQHIRDKLEATVKELENIYSSKMEETAYLRAAKESAAGILTQQQNQLETVISRLDMTRSLLGDKNEELRALPSKEEIQEKISVREQALQDTYTKQAELQKAQERAGKDQASALEKYNQTEKALETFSTEISTIEEFVKLDSEEAYGAILEDITVEDGFEAALSKALGDALSASENEDAPQVWMEPIFAGKLPELPEDCYPLFKITGKAPVRLKPALQMIGVVEDETQGNRLRSKLRPGQSLVSKNGAFWRWDGLHIKASSIDRNAVHLQQKNRLAELKARFPFIKAALYEASKECNEAQKHLQEITGNLFKTSRLSEELNREISGLHKEIEQNSRERTTAEREAARLQEALDLHLSEKKRLESEIFQSNKELEKLENTNITDENSGIDVLKTSLQNTREELREAVRACDLASQRQETRKARLHALADERVSLQNRTIRSRERVKTLEEREKILSAKLEELKNKPLNIQTGRDELFEKIAEAERKRNETADKLVRKETEAGETAKALKSAENELSSIRENRASLQAVLGETSQRLEELDTAIKSKFEIRPVELPSQIGMDPLALAEEDVENLRARREKLMRERDNIGPVNLRADTEARELEKELTVLLNERNDLLEAIAELRSGIQKLNSEARERLVSAFEHVNAHFTGLFSRLFNGGQAYLSLVDAEDPLEAGLEIFAQPPGKTLQTISLLSGGEQALTSAALVFAMFLTNPSPICVLDEIDAPLDDANVDRLCDVLEEMAEAGKTRFLVITHHGLTMARMDRLYGVTMAEQGVSQLVSVDLQQSFEFLEAAE
jgi:chromosome segregation protein